MIFLCGTEFKVPYNLPTFPDPSSAPFSLCMYVTTIQNDFPFTNSPGSPPAHAILTLLLPLMSHSSCPKTTLTVTHPLHLPFPPPPSGWTDGLLQFSIFSRMLLPRMKALLQQTCIKLRPGSSGGAGSATMYRTERFAWRGKSQPCLPGSAVPRGPREQLCQPRPTEQGRVWATKCGTLGKRKGESRERCVADKLC